MRAKQLNFDIGTFSFEGISETDAYFQELSTEQFEGYLAFLRRFASPSSVVVDVGANIGVTSVLASAMAPHGAVLSIEAGPSVFATLERNMASNRRENVRCVWCAAGDDDGMTMMNELSAWGFRVDGNPWPRYVERAVPVPMRRMDSLMAEHGMARPDIVKIDTEGWELEVVEGMGDLKHDAVVYMEFNSWCLAGIRNEKPLEILRRLRRHFPYLYFFVGDSIERIVDANELDFLHRNFVINRCTEDLLAAQRALDW